MTGTNPDLVVRIAANISALQADMSSAAASVKAIEGAVVTAHAASTSWAGGLNDLGHSWVLRIAEGELLRDAVREVITSLKEMAAFLPELAMKGAAVGDVEESFKHLATQAGLTSAVLLGTLRAGTHGTIDDFELMQRTNKDLAAGLNLTDAQFGLLSQGAFALAKATGGSTKDALDSMSDAMVTGRAKGVALLTGKIDLKAAEEAFAEALGGTKDNLTAEGKLEADRQAILAGVAAGLARVGEQTDGLDERVAQATTSWKNFEDELGKTIAQSPVILGGFDSLKASLISAFGGDQAHLVETIAATVNDLAIKVVDFGIGAGAVAGALVQIWYGIKTAILAVETVIVGVVDGFMEELALAAEAGAKLHLVSPGTVAEIVDIRTQTRAMTVDLAAQTVEAAKGAMGQSALGETITKGTGILYTMRDAMLATAKTTKESADETAIHAANTEKLAALQAQMNAAAKAQAEYLKQTDAEKKAAAKLEAEQIAETTKLWDEYYKVVNAADHDTMQARINDAWLTADAQIAALEKTKVITLEDYDIIWAKAQQTADNIIQKTLESDNYSKEHYQLLADQAQIAYQFALDHASSYTQEEIRLRGDAAREAERLSGHWAQTAVDDMDKVKGKTAETASHFGTSWGGQFTEVEKDCVTWRTAMSMASASIDADLQSNIKNVRTLAGEYLTAADAKKLFDSGGSAAIPDLTQDTVDRMGGRAVIEQMVSLGRPMNPGTFTPEGIADLARRQASYDAMVLYLARVPQAADGLSNFGGGIAIVGERGPELVNLPKGSDVFPTGTGPDGGVTVHNTIYVNGTAADVARQVAAEIMKSAKFSRKFGSA